MSEPARPEMPRATWTGPERRVKRYLVALGWQVVRAGRAFLPWHLLAVHPTEGVRLLWVHPPHGPGPDLSALVAFPCDVGYIREVWRYSGHAIRPIVARVNGGPAAPVSREV